MALGRGVAQVHMYVHTKIRDPTSKIRRSYGPMK